MRIVAGDLKGRPIVAPPGKATRPTTDRVREALFNVIAHADWAPAIEGARIVDLFAGSGALGLEALSRGAAFCLFVETDTKARGAIRDNVETFSLFGTTRVHRRSATDLGSIPAGLGAPFDIAFLDPPYGKALAPLALESLHRGDWLSSDAIVIVETGEDEALNVSGWDLLDERTSGASTMRILKRS